jgi:hypothetical protein
MPSVSLWLRPAAPSAHQVARLGTVAGVLIVTLGVAAAGDDKAPRPNVNAKGRRVVA